MRLKLIAKEKGKYISVTIFIGDGDTLTNCGILHLQRGEWQLFATSVSLGAKQMQNHLKVEIDESALSNDNL